MAGGWRGGDMMMMMMLEMTAIDHDRQLDLLWKFSLMANEHVRQ